MHHGLANAINLPYGVGFNYEGMESEFARVGKAMGLKDVSRQILMDKLFDLNSTIGIPEKLAAKGVNADHIDSLTTLALKDFCLPGNPKVVNEEDFRHLYLAAIG